MATEVARGTLTATKGDVNSTITYVVETENIIGSSSYHYAYTAVRTYVIAKNDAMLSISKGRVTFSCQYDGYNRSNVHTWDGNNISGSSSTNWIKNGIANSESTKYYSFNLNRYSTASTVTLSIEFRVCPKAASLDNYYGSDSTTVSITVPALPTYTISYNANGGTNAPASQTKQYSYDITLTTAVPTRNSYTFNSWNTKADGSGNSYASGARYSEEYDKTLYAIWNPQIMFNANGGSGAPSTITKTFNEAATIPNDAPTKPGYTFIGWDTQMAGGGTAYSPGDTVAAEMNTALTLYAQYDKITAPPTISSITVIRCNSSGVANDAGAYAKIEAVWSVDRTYDSSNAGTATGKYKANGASSYTTFSFTSGSSGASGTATAIVSGMDTDTQYEFVVTVTDTNSETGHTNTTTRTTILTRAKFLMDFRAGGMAMGIGSAAPQSGLEVGFEAQFDDDVTVLGDIEAANLSAGSDSGTDVASATGTFSVSSAYGRKFGPMRMVGVTFSSSASLAAGTAQTLGTMETAYSPPLGMGFANTYGTGFVDSGGTVYFTPHVAVSAGTSIYVAFVFINVSA